MGFKIIEVDLEWTRTPTMRAARYCKECCKKIEGPSLDVTIICEGVFCLEVGRFCEDCFGLLCEDLEEDSGEEPVEESSSGTK